jgi:hypothetical protein
MYQYLGADLWERSGTFAASMHGLSLAALEYCTAGWGREGSQGAADDALEVE